MKGPEMNIDKRATGRPVADRPWTRLAWAGVASVALAGGLAACASGGSRSADVTESLKSSFNARPTAGLERLDQSELQRACSDAAGKPLPKAVADRLQEQALASIKYPADGQFLGDWKEGERIAQSGRGLQFTDAPGTVAGGNCYACHRLSRQELAYGTIGPSLYQYGKLRGNSAETVKYTWSRLWNPHAFNACNAMPRFGAAGILTEQQLKHVMALLLDPASPVNQ